MRAELSLRIYSATGRRLFVQRQLPWVCRTCYEQLHRTSIPSTSSTRRITTKVKPPAPTLNPVLRGLVDEEPVSQSLPIKTPKERPLTYSEKRAIQRLDILLEDSQAILQKDAVPPEAEVLEALKICRGLADYFRAIKDKPALTTVKPGGEAGNLLFLEDPTDKNATKQELSPIMIGSMASSIADSAMDMISTAVNKIAEDDKVFMTPAILLQVVEILSMLGRPETLAQIFILYAEKPAPIQDSKPIRYRKANPNKIASAVPLNIAQIALDASIKAQNLPLCLDITEQTVCTKAYRRSKVFRKALLPGAVASMTPVCAYLIASHVAEMQDAMSTSMMTMVGTAGIMTYLGALGPMGFITITTANDQMDRVTWAPGMHLRQRWLREDERAFMDQIACAWGFKDRSRRGEEEGPDWEALKELCGIRGMVLDRVELMDGMQ